MTTFLIAMFLLIASPVCAGVTAVEPLVEFSPLTRETCDHIEELLAWRDEVPPVSLAVSHLLSHQDISRLYAARGYLPLWLKDGILRPEAAKLVERLRGAGEHGLCAEAYLLDKLEGLLKLYDDFALYNVTMGPMNRALLDLFLSQAFLTYATHLVEGQVDPALAHVDWRARRRKADLVKLLNYALEHDRVEQVLDDLLPPHDGYRQLVKALSEYRRIHALGGWPSLPGGSTLRSGDQDERVSTLRQRLAISGDLLEPGGDGNMYDRELVTVVKRFQVRHGLDADGVVGAKTLAALNVTAAERVRQLELNLERWRWQPKSFGRRHLVINIADFTLAVVEDGKPVMTMPVIVGTPYRKTPVFSARMSYLEFAPYWTVPSTILREDKLPKIKHDPAYLDAHHYRVLREENNEWVPVDLAGINWSKLEAEHFPGILRMEPGPWNPLGRVKFMFPNVFNVYLHDTNEPELFTREVRSFSSGCIRAQRPVDLAQYLLVDQGKMDCGQLLDLLDSPAPQRVDINLLPVHIQYWTAWVDANGAVNFRDDVYFRDLDLEVALGEPEYWVSERLLVKSGEVDMSTVH